MVNINIDGSDEIMYLDNHVIGKDKGFSFEVISREDEWGNCEYQAVISNDRKLWVKKVGFKTESFPEACNEAEWYMIRGFKFGKVEYKPNREKVAVS